MYWQEEDNPFLSFEKVPKIHSVNIFHVRKMTWKLVTNMDISRKTLLRLNVTDLLFGKKKRISRKNRFSIGSSFPKSRCKNVQVSKMTLIVSLHVSERWLRASTYNMHTLKLDLFYYVQLCASTADKMSTVIKRFIDI